MTLFSVFGNGSEWDLYSSHSLFDVHVPVVSESLPDDDVLRASALEKKKKKKTEKGNFVEMAEGATTLKGLRAQMGKKNLGSRGYLSSQLCHTI